MEGGREGEEREVEEREGADMMTKSLLHPGQCQYLQDSCTNVC